MFFMADVSAKNVVSRAVWRGVAWRGVAWCWCLGLLGKEGRMRKRGAVCETHCARSQRVLRA